MTLKQHGIDVRALMLVLFAFLGNAALAGLDLVLTIIFPITIVLSLSLYRTIPKSSLLPLFGLMFILSVAIVRSAAVGIPYMDGYYLWPIKAIALIGLVHFVRMPNWPIGNLFALSGSVFILVLVGNVQDGRLYSIFGPNMLYRIFGIFLISSLVYYYMVRGVYRIVLLSFIALAIYSLILTGSSGAMIVLLIGFVIFVHIFLKKLNFLSRYLALLMLVAGVLALMLFYKLGDESVILSRTLYKFGTIEVSDRFIGWSGILSRPFLIFGYTHSELNEYWTLEYIYPHNIFMELYSFFGVLGVAIIFLILVSLFKAIPSMLSGDIFAITYIVLLIGSTFSGDLSDNYGVIGLAGAILLRSKKIIYNFRNSTMNKTAHEVLLKKNLFMADSGTKYNVDQPQEGG